MSISNYMTDYLKDAKDDMQAIADDLNCHKSACCQQNRLQMWDNEAEGRLHMRVTALVTRIDEILKDVEKVMEERKG